MKRLFALILAVPLVVLAGCQPGEGLQEGDLPVVRVLADLTMGGNTDALCLELEQFFQENAPGCGEDYLVEVEALPTLDQPDEREPAVTKTHMELLEGGADVFLLRNFTDTTGLYPDIQNLFPYPASAMGQELFLPLDDYTAKDEDWQNLLPQVMEAGRFEGNQYIVPLSFHIRVSLADSAVHPLPEGLPMSCGDMLASPDPLTRWAANDGLSMLGVLADYEKETLSFTEEELLTLIEDIRQAQPSPEELDLQGLAPSVSVSQLNDAFFSPEGEVDYYMLPAYNRQGGVTAWVEVFGAVNRNTSHPEEAASLLKACYGPAGQANATLTSMALPVYRGLEQQSAPGAGGWYFKEWDYQQLEALQEQINAVEFPSLLTAELDSLFRDCAQLGDSQAVQKAVEESYARMATMLLES